MVNKFLYVFDRDETPLTHVFDLNDETSHNPGRLISYTVGAFV